jgi:SAM-dependent methyltransferase
MANPVLIKGVVELLQDVRGKGGCVLDVSCKEGEILQALKSQGFTVQGTNFTEDAEEIDGIPIDWGVDLLKGLPYAAESFDIVLLVEVIEHLENHQVAIAEVARVLKPGGVLILTTPNIMRLNSRLHFFLTGYHKTKRRFIPFDTPLSQAYQYHNYPIDLPIFYYLLKKNGLAVEQLGQSRVKSFSWLLFFLFAPLVMVYTFYFLYLREKDERQRQENLRLCSWLLHPRLLLQDNWVLRLRKVGKG